MPRSLPILAILLMAACATSSPPAPPANESFVTMDDGVRLFVRTTTGTTGGPVVFLHGGPGGSMADGGYEMEELLPERRWILYDQRGSGRSDRPDPSTITAARHAEDLEQIRRALGHERITIVGLSWGSALAAMYAEKYPQRVERVVFLSPMPLALKPFAEERFAATSKQWETDAPRRAEVLDRMKTATGRELLALCRERFVIDYGAYVVRPESLERARRCERAERIDLDGTPAGIRTMESLGEDWDFRPALRTLPVPALVIEGAQSKVPLSTARAWAEALPHGRLLLIEDAGHANWLDRPEAFRAAVREFLDEKPHGVATFSILGYDPKTGEVGGAVQSRVFSVGNGVLWAEAGAGVVATQAIVDVSYGQQGLELLRAGMTPAAAVKAIWESDPDPRPEDWTKQGRQFAIMDAKGNYAAYTGPKATAWAGHKGGTFCTAQGNILASEKVVAEMVKAFETTPGHLSLRLMAALEAGQQAGGDTRGMQSAAMLIVKENGGVWLNNDTVLRLQVDDHPKPLDELRRLVELAAAQRARIAAMQRERK
ncbi:MAG TPA: alpha/beta fold hydrolase [Thermoanaerobaculia bacterium]|jgi:proline-specific peptidase